MGAFIDLSGQKFGRLTAIERIENNKSGETLWLCKCICGKESTVAAGRLRSGKTRSCGCLKLDNPMLQKGKDHHNWKGGRHIVPEGYVKLNMPEHPNSSKHGYVLEHIKVMSEYLGRPMTKKETVHHINGVRDDNRLENLELWSSRHPRGQRVEDKVAWAQEILELYKDFKQPAGRYK